MTTTNKWIVGIVSAVVIVGIFVAVTKSKPTIASNNPSLNPSTGPVINPNGQSGNGGAYKKYNVGGTIRYGTLDCFSAGSTFCTFCPSDGSECGEVLNSSVTLA